MEASKRLNKVRNKMAKNFKECINSFDSFTDWFGFFMGCIVFCASVITFGIFFYYIITSPQTIFVKGFGVVMTLYLIYTFYFEER